MADEQIIYETADGVATVTLNRPDKLNAWTARMGEEVRRAMEAAEADPTVRVIVLTGAGRAFCAGADMSLLSEIAAEGHADADHPLAQADAHSLREGIPADFQRKYSYFPSIRKPVIAAINGPAVGLGFVISLYCDLRLASDEGSFNTAFARRGLIAEYGIAWMLPRLIGPAQALDLLLSARTVNAAEALRVGLVNAVYPAATFRAQVHALAAELATSVSPRSTAVIKNQVYNSFFQTLEAATIMAEQAALESVRSDDFREGIAHFLEKRKPAFTGR
jgi:enoyl-CoA hydratase/carnithine racemase